MNKTLSPVSEGCVSSGVLQQEADDLCVTFGGRHMQSRPAVIVHSVYIHSWQEVPADKCPTLNIILFLISFNDSLIILNSRDQTAVSSHLLRAWTSPLKAASRTFMIWYPCRGAETVTVRLCADFKP